MVLLLLTQPEALATSFSAPSGLFPFSAVNDRKTGSAHVMPKLICLQGIQNLVFIEQLLAVAPHFRWGGHAGSFHPGVRLEGTVCSFPAS
jgi:hypothetical protein